MLYLIITWISISLLEKLRPAIVGRNLDVWMHFDIQKSIYLFLELLFAMLMDGYILIVL